MTGGTRTVLIGLLMHVAVAFTWSAVFLLLAGRIAPVRRILTSRFGALALAAVYGPFVWLVMSLAVIPAMTHRPAAVNFRWWVQFFGHIPFVALPIAVVARHPLSTRRQTRA
jgi:uncharacterized membrane protein YagU involved in acid resistance